MSNSWLSTENRTNAFLNKTALFLVTETRFSMLKRVSEMCFHQKRVYFIEKRVCDSNLNRWNPSGLKSGETMKKVRCIDSVDGGFDEDYPEKRVKLEENSESTRANDLIRLIFPLLSDEAFVPSFTHQLFEDEKVDFLSDDERNARITVSVDVSRSLMQSVCVEGIQSNITLQMLADHLHNGLPKDVYYPQSPQASNSNNTSNDALSDPVGILHCTFTVNANSTDTTYYIYKANHTHKGAIDLIHRAEKLAMWWIETADSVDFTDDRWEAMFLYEGNGSDNETMRYLFVGYMTLFTFHNPVLGDIERVCQALVLPPRQSRGLGRELLLAVYRSE
jgi:hypothetical protein